MPDATQSPRFTERRHSPTLMRHAPRRPTRARVTMLALLFVATTINYVDRSNLSIVAPFLSKELGLDPVQMGLLFSAFAWSYAIANLPGGYLIDRFGSRLDLRHRAARMVARDARTRRRERVRRAVRTSLRRRSRRSARLPGQQPRRLHLVPAARARPRDVDVCVGTVRRLGAALAAALLDGGTRTGGARCSG